MFDRMLSSLTEGDQIEKLVMLAAAEGMLNEEDLSVLRQEARISVKKVTQPEKIARIKEALPKEAFKKFRLIYGFMERLLKKGALSQQVESILMRALRVLGLQVERIRELISFLKVNIQNGLSLDESYKRLGYLVQ
jgi:hypothetical protein